jgi:hypothetical protein
MKKERKISVICTFALISFVLLFTGCISFTNFETAQTAAPGRFQFGGSFSPIVILSSETGGGSVILPFADLSAKIGLTDRFDIGARWVLPFGMYLNTKYQFLKNNIDGALFVEGSYYGAVGEDNTAYYTVTPAIIFSREKPGQFPFSILLGLFNQGTGSTNTSAIKANLGFPFRIGAQHSIRVMPEIGILRTFGEEITGIWENQGSTIFQLGVGFSSVKKDY